MVCYCRTNRSYRDTTYLAVSMSLTWLIKRGAKKPEIMKEAPEWPLESTIWPQMLWTALISYALLHMCPMFCLTRLSPLPYTKRGVFHPAL